MDHLADANDLMAYIAASPTPRHAVAETARRLEAAGFGAPPPTAEAVEAGYRVRGGSIIAWRSAAAEGAGDNTPCRLITAHTDSPNLRIKPRPDTTSVGVRQLGVEVYGGALINSWLDRDLGLAGHVILRQGDDVTTRLVMIARPVMRIPQLAIHLDREINTKGLLLNKQTHMRPMWGLEGDEESGLIDVLAQELDVAPSDVLAFELMAYDLAAPSLGGWHDEFIAAPRIDNQLSCWAATEALIAATDATGPRVIALFDHEEVGSTSATGADSSLLSGFLDEFADAALDGALCISADCAHATHPNYADRHDADHQIALNGGPVIKVNANERYATTPMGHALFVDACKRAGVDHQVFVNRSDLACGSTVGPITAARTGIETVDVGAPQLAMHSARETTGSQDPHDLKRALIAVFD